MMAGSRLNVLVAVLGGARADHLSSGGYSRPTTPFLGQVAQEGVRFPHTIAVAGSTLPSLASLFTGLFASTHGATEEHRSLSQRFGVLPEYLQRAGYRTGVFCPNPGMSPDTGFGRGVDCFETQRHPNPMQRGAQVAWRRLIDRLLRRADAGARRTNRALLRWLAAGDAPFFALVHYDEPRRPWRIPPPYDRKFLARGVGRERVRRIVDQAAEDWGAVDLTEDERSILTAAHDGALCYVDARLREIAEALRRSDRWDNTLLIVTADRGENLGDHRMAGDQWGLFDTILRVPLILRCPAEVPQGFVVEELAQTTDIVPTVLSLVGVSHSGARLPGRPLIVDGRATSGPAFTIAERFRPNLARLRERVPPVDTRPHDVRKKAIRTRREKFVWHSDEANEFYDLSADPGETRNLIEQETVRADALRTQLFDWLAQIEQCATDPGVAGEIDASARELRVELGNP